MGTISESHVWTDILIMQSCVCVLWSMCTPSFRSVVDQFKELCARKVQTTIQSTRSIAKVDVDGVGGGRMREIKLNLDAQLSQVADPPVAVKVGDVCALVTVCVCVCVLGCTCVFGYTCACHSHNHPQ